MTIEVDVACSCCNTTLPAVPQPSHTLIDKFDRGDGGCDLMRYLHNVLSCVRAVGPLQTEIEIEIERVETVTVLVV
jgi:hypothetical protein